MEIEKIRADYIKQFDQTFASECKIQFGSIHHSKKIRAIVVTPDDKRLITGSVDKSMIIWNLETRKSIRRIRDQEKPDQNGKGDKAGIGDEKGDESDKGEDMSKLENGRSFASEANDKTEDDKPRPGFNSLAISNNGQYLVSVNEKGSMMIWNMRTMQPKIKFDLNVSKSIRKVAISPDSKHFVTGNRDGSIKLWNFNKKEDVLKFPTKHTKGITALEISPNGLYLVSASKDLSICVWNFESKSLIEQRNDAHNSVITSLAISMDSKFFATGASDGVIKIWFFDRKKEPYEINNHTGPISGLSLTKDGRYLVSSSYIDDIIQIWNLYDKKVEHTFVNVHEDGVHSLATTNDSLYIITGSGQGRIKMWGIDERAMIESFAGAHDEEVINVAITVDGKYIVSTAFDKSIKIWNTKNQEMEHVIPNADEDDIFNIAISRDNKMFVTGSGEGSMKLWNFEDASLIHHFEKAHTQHIMAVLITKDSRTIVSASSDNTIKLWNVYEKTMDYCFREPHIGGVLAMQLNPTENYLITASGDKSIKKWDIEEKICDYHIEDAHNEEIFALAVHLKYIVSGSGDKTIKIWDINTKYLYFTFKDAHRDAIWSLSISADAKYLVSGSVDKTMKVWNMSHFQEIHHFDNAHDSQITQTIITSDNSFIVSCSFDKTIKVWQLESESLLKNFEDVGELGIKEIALSGDEATLACIIEPNSIQLWDLHDKIIKRTYDDNDAEIGSITCLAITNNGQYIAYGTFNGSSRVYDLAKNEFINPSITNKQHAGQVNTIQFTSDDINFVTGSEDKSVILWNTKTGEVAGKFKEKHKEDVLDVAISRNNQYVVSCSADRSMNLWKIKKLHLEHHFENAHTGPIVTVAISFNMKYIISGSTDQSIKIWDMKTFEMKHQFADAHDRTITALSIHHNSTYLISCSEDKCIKIWNIENKDLIHEFQNAHEEHINTVCCSQKGDFFLSGSDDRSIKMWKIPSLILKSKYSSLYLGIFPKLYEDDEWLILPYNFNEMHDFFLRVFHVNEISNLASEDKYKIFASIIAKKMHFEDIRHEKFYKFLERTDRFGNIPFEYVIGHEHMKNILKINFLKFQKKFNVPNFMYLMNEMHHKFLAFLESETKSNSKIVITFLGLCLDQFDEDDQKKGRLAPNFKRAEYGLSTNQLVEAKYSCLDNHIQSQLMKETDERESQKLKFYRSTWPLNFRLYSKDTYDLLNFLGKQNKRFYFENKFIMMIFQYFWTKSKKYQMILFYFHSGFMILFTINCIFSEDPNYAFQIVLLIYGAILFLSEVMQLRIRGLIGLLDFWNIQDFICYTSCIITMSFTITDFETELIPYLKTLCLFSGYFRWIGYLRVFDGMRSLIRTIIEILKDMKSLVIVLIFTMTAYSAILESFNYGSNYFESLYSAYLFLYESQLPMDLGYGLKAITMIFPFVINVIFLNMLISLMGDTFDKLQEKSLFADNQEKLKLILEIVSFARYFHSYKVSLTKKNQDDEKGPIISKRKKFLMCLKNCKNEKSVKEKNAEALSSSKTLRLPTMKDQERRKSFLGKTLERGYTILDSGRGRGKPSIQETEAFYIDSYVKKADTETFYLMYCEEDAGDAEIEWEGKMNYISRQIDQTKENITKVQKSLDTVRKELKSEIAGIKETTGIQISLMQSNLNYLVRKSGKSTDCSVESSGIKPVFQDCYLCLKCNIMMCIECTQECHQGHHLRKENMKEFVCQCSFLYQDCKKKVNCSFKYTARKYYEQKCFTCKTCADAMPENHSICMYCKEKCHSGHELIPKDSKEGLFCDCPESCPEWKCHYRKEYLKQKERERLESAKKDKKARDKRDLRPDKSLIESENESDSEKEAIRSIFTKTVVSQMDLEKIEKLRSKILEGNSKTLLEFKNETRKDSIDELMRRDVNFKTEINIKTEAAIKTEAVINKAATVITLNNPSKHCTIESSATIEIEQECYYCKTCDIRFCQACSENCHKEHDYESMGEVSFVCECYFKNPVCSKRNFCTYKYTRENNYPQLAFNCTTCNLGSLLCGYCAKTCHQGHTVELDEYNFLSFCDCSKKSPDLCKLAKSANENEKKKIERKGFKGMTKVIESNKI